MLNKEIQVLLERCGPNDDRYGFISADKYYKHCMITSWHGNTFYITFCVMMTSANGNIFRVTGHLCEEFTVPGEFPAQRPVTRSFDVFFDLRLNKRLSKQSWGWRFDTLLRPLWRHCNGGDTYMYQWISSIKWQKCRSLMVQVFCCVFQ